MSDKKVAFLIYPMFCTYEVSLLLEMLAAEGKTVVTFALEQGPVLCEEGLRVVPDKQLDELDLEEYDCLLLTGIGGNPDAVLYNKAYAEFLSRFRHRDDLLIASISLSPALLAQAGLLDGKKFCVGMYEDDREELHYFDYNNQVRAPLVTDGNVITAMGLAYREFAIEVMQKLGYDWPANAFSGIKYPIKPEDYICWFNEDIAN